MQEVGLISIRALGRAPDLQARVRALGYDRFSDVRRILEQERDPTGKTYEVLVGWEGIGWRWNDPACRIRR